MRVIAGLAIGALALSVLSLWVTSRGLRELGEEQASLARELGRLRAQRASNRPSAGRMEGMLPAPHAAAPTTGWAGEGDPLPAALAAAQPGEAPAPTAEQFEELPSAPAPAALFARYETPYLLSPARTVQDMAIFARWGDDEARKSLLEALDDPDPDVRMMALDFVAEFGDSEAIASLARLANDPEPDVRMELAEELGSTGSAAAGPLLQALLHDESPDVVEHALKSLGELRYAPAYEDIRRFATSEEIKVAAAAGRTLRALGDGAGAEKVVERLARRIEDDDPETRHEVLRALHRIGGESAENHLAGALQDPAPKLQGKAEWYLMDLTR